MTTIGYIRVSTDEQDLDKQRHLLLEHSQRNKVLIDDFVEVEISSRKNQHERRITELMDRLSDGDLLLVAELSRLGRNMLETLNIIHQLTQKGVKIVFIRQPELSTTGAHTQLLLAIYSYFAEAEREFISLRTKQGLAAVKAKGIKLGRPKGRANKERPLDPYREQIKKHLEAGLPVPSIMKLINPHLEQPLTYNSYRYFIDRDDELRALYGK
jgi:DNA invertase Pin-like site-specific DNA recombinase